LALDAGSGLSISFEGFEEITNNNEHTLEQQSKNPSLHDCGRLSPIVQLEALT